MINIVGVVTSIKKSTQETFMGKHVNQVINMWKIGVVGRK